MRNPFYIFKIKREERWGAIIALLYVVLWNALVVYTYADKAFAVSDNYRKLFAKLFHISGFDPISYIVISHWSAGYNIYRHPLLAFFMWIPNQINQGLIMLTGMNWATVIMAIILVFCGFYSFILLYRTFREVIGLRCFDSWLLGWLTFSFAYVMVGMSVPDHFGLSMFMLILTLYVAGRKLKAHHPFTKWQTVLFFFVTAGISLNNGIKVFLANLFVNGKKFFKPANLILAVVVPSLLIWYGARLEWKHFERPNYIARQQLKAKKDSTLRARMYIAFRDTTSLKDSAAIQKAYNQLVEQKIQAKYIRDHKKAWNLHKGKPIDKSEFGQWTDISTPRWASLVENIFGEPIQLHQDYTLKDVLVNRPVIVEYRYVFNYVIEGIIVLLFLLGIICGTFDINCNHKLQTSNFRPQRFLWLAMSFFGFDMLIHLVLGFGLNEAYIMSPHWLFIITIAIGYLVKRLTGTRMYKPLQVLLLLLTAYLLVWNGALYADYLL